VGYSRRAPSRDEFNNLTFEQVWFAGNHADIGGGYQENESWLSDTTLKWMLACAYIIPNGIKYDRSVLRLHSDPAGIQHDEVKSGFGTIPNFVGVTWPYRTRELPKMEIANGVTQPCTAPCMSGSTWTKFLTTTL
jgi:hypothetical protein